MEHFDRESSWVGRAADRIEGQTWIVKYIYRQVCHVERQLPTAMTTQLALANPTTYKSLAHLGPPYPSALLCQPVSPVHVNVPTVTTSLSQPTLAWEMGTLDHPQ